ncbi:galactose-6-phosphate isomerase subunit LacA [Vagococcus lutrae]|uniref:Galactose-6-phosphate isomerase subunit LacA n=1 Tax=Vagococcus lutrae TaxID=81947 RepID=A0AAE9XMN4_9ENTE|nr:galactose-6-phosphate isomerase subunit LacA [Vagococcus lutrae]WCG22898.1 galactose-6-phosphate isomerase subunit LacA [Vagococcus lutrae]
MKKIVIGSDKDGFDLKEKVKKMLLEKKYEIIDVSETPSLDFVESSLDVTNVVLNNEDSCGLMFDGYGVGSFLASNKVQGMITANVTDENSAKMTADHNNARAISIGTKVVGESLGMALVENYVNSAYSGGRHQVRVDMLNKML